MKSGAVVLIYPKLEPSVPKRINYFPLPVLALAGPLEKAGYDVRVIDGRVDDYREALRVPGERPLCVGISTMAGYQLGDGLNAADAVRDVWPGVPLVWGGKFPTIQPDEMLADARVDIVVRGQGEITLLELLGAIREGRDLSGVAGLSWKSEGRVVHNAERPVVPPDDLPMMAYHLVDARKYNCVAKGAINYISSYGCPFQCAFCTTKYIYKRKWMGMDPTRVLDEIEFLVKTYHVKLFDIQDDLFFANKSRAKAILQGFVDRKLGIEWITTARFNQLVAYDDEMFTLIRESGCHMLYASAESGVQKVLDYVLKDLKVEQIAEGVRLLSKYGIPTRTTFLLGTPVETLDDMKATLRFSLEMKRLYPALDIYFSFYIPIPGTQLWEMASREGVVVKPASLQEWADFIPVDQSQPWLFIPIHRLQVDRRRMHRIVAFYYWAGYFPKLREYLGSRGLGLLALPLIAAARLRVKLDFFHVPWEWALFAFVFSRTVKRAGGSNS